MLLLLGVVVVLFRPKCLGLVFLLLLVFTILAGLRKKLETFDVNGDVVDVRLYIVSGMGLLHPV